MRRMVKKLSVLLICLCMIFNVYTGEAKASISDMDDYALSVAADMLRINGYDAADSINISSKIRIFNMEGSQRDKYVYMVLDNEEPTAMLVVEMLYGEYYASLELGVPEEIADVYKENIPFALCNYDGCLILHTEEDNIVVSNDFGAEISEDNLDYSSVNLQSMTVTYENVMSASESVSLPGNTIEPQATYGAYTVSTLGVPYIANGNSPADGGGICWAACIAAISNYRTGTNHTAFGLYNNLWSYYSGYGSGNYPVGTETWKKRAFAYCGLSYTYTGGLNGSQVSAALSSNRPIMMDIFGDNGHSVVLKGIYVYGNNNNYYQLMDPNKSSTVTVTVSDNVLNSSSYFKCTLLSGTYSNWGYSYY